MKLLILKTDIQSVEKVKAIMPVFNEHPRITFWTVDTEDIDNVLKIVAYDDLSEKEIFQLIKARGFNCEALMD